MKFSIRDLLWLTLVVALCVSFWLYDKKLRDELALTRDIAKSIYLGQIMMDIEANGGVDNVHWLHYSYSRFYGIEYEIGLVNESPKDRIDRIDRIRKRLDRNGTPQPTWSKLLRD